MIANGCMYVPSKSHWAGVSDGVKLSLEWLWAIARTKPCTSNLTGERNAAFIAQQYWSPEPATRGANARLQLIPDVNRVKQQRTLFSTDGEQRIHLLADAQVGIDDAAVVHQRLRRAAQRHGAHFEHVGAICHLQRGPGVLFNQQHRHAELAQ